MINQERKVKERDKLILVSCLIIFLFPFFTSCSGQDKVSTKAFEEISLVNQIQFQDEKYDQRKFSCGFLLKYNNDTFAVTAKHLLKVIKPEKMKTLLFDGMIKQWAMYPLNKKRGSRNYR